MASASLCCAGQSVEFFNEAADTTRINQLLSKRCDGSKPGELVEYYGRQFLGTEYRGGTLEGKEEVLRVDLNHLDCTTFVETVMALGITAGENRSSWRDFTHNLRSLRYRGGVVDGYCSRLHYISDWAVDNTHRGNIKEVTGQFEDAVYEVKTLDFMTANRDLYPALASSDNFMMAKEVESGYKSHRFPVIKTKSISKAAKDFLKTGDVIALTCSKKGLDVSHMGIVVFEDGVARLLHASSKSGKVVIDKLPLADYLTKNRHLTGIRVFRLDE